MGYASIPKSGVGALSISLAIANFVYEQVNCERVLGGGSIVNSCQYSKSEISINHNKFIYMYDSIVIEPKEGTYFDQCKWDSQVVEIMDPQE